MATNRPNLVLAVAVALVVLTALVAGIVSSVRQGTQYDPSTPEGVVQDYLAAVADRDNLAAAELLAEDNPCRVEDLDREWVPENVRVVLREVEVDGATAQVRVGISLSTGQLFGGAEYFEDHTVRLARSDDEWRITGAPWPMYECGRDG